jgi:formate dehydrogenase subunit beta
MEMVGKCYLAWAKDDEISERGASGGFVTATFVSALENDFLDAVLVVKKKDTYEGIPTITSDQREVIECAGSLHTVPINLTKYIDPDPERRIGMPAKPCDARGIMEQAKRKQIDLGRVYLVGLNCGGTLHPLRARAMVEELYKIDPDDVIGEEILRGELILKTKEGEISMRMDELEEKGYGRRDACKSCGINIPTMADMACGNWGVPRDRKATFVEVLTEKGEDIFKNAVQAGYVAYEEASEKGIEIRKRIDETMRKLAAQWKEKIDILPDSGSDRLNFYIETLRNCIHCGACKEVCPVCSCKGENAKCVVMHDERDSHLIPAYNLIRLLHLMDSCIGCGQCEDVCPVDIPLTLIHRRFAERMQLKLDYIPGMDLRRPPFYDTELIWEAE